MNVYYLLKIVMQQPVSMPQSAVCVPERTFSAAGHTRAHIFHLADVPGPERCRSISTRLPSKKVRKRYALVRQTNLALRDVAASALNVQISA
jgi:hypothetical protein